MIKLVKNYAGDWDVWHKGRIVAEDFDTVGEAVAWIAEYVKDKNL